jgi:hypothetical protein
MWRRLANISSDLILREFIPPGWKPGSTAGKMPAATNGAEKFGLKQKYLLECQARH